MSPAHDLIAVTLWLLREHPEEWEFDQFTAKHRQLGIEVWIANSLYGLRIRGPGMHTREASRLFTGWLIPWRREVMRAVQEAAGRELKRRAAAEYPAAPSALARGGVR